MLMYTQKYVCWSLKQLDKQFHAKIEMTSIAFIGKVEQGYCNLIFTQRILNSKRLCCILRNIYPVLIFDLVRKISMIFQNQAA